MKESTLVGIGNNIQDLRIKPISGKGVGGACPEEEIWPYARRAGGAFHVAKAKRP